jgi:HEAT repeat protein
VPQVSRRRAKAFIDVLVQRFGKGVAALLLLPVTFGVLAVDHVGVMTLLAVALWLWVAGRTRREYVRTFREGLKAAASRQPEGIDTSDVTTVTTLVHSLGSSDEREVLHSLDLLASHGQGRLVPPLLLHHESGEVRRRTLKVLAEVGREDAAGLVERALTDDEADVRSGAIHALAVLRGEGAVEMMAGRLRDPDPRLRGAAVASVLELGGHEELADQAVGVLAEMLHDGDPEVRMEAARALGHVTEPIGREAVVQLLYDRHRGVVREAIAAVRRRLSRSEPNPMYVPILISLMGNRRLKHGAREAIVAYGLRAVEALELFMWSPDEQVWVRRAVPKTIALIGGEPAAAALLRGLEAQDTFMRTKVVEALAYLRSRDSALVFKQSSIQRQIAAEARAYLRNLADLWAVSSMHQVRLDGPHPAWRSEGRVPSLVQQVLAQRMVGSVRNTFGLLELILKPEDVAAAHRSLTSGNPTLRARALEYLDNTLSRGLRRDVFAAIDDAPAEDKLRRAGQLFEIFMQSPEDTLRRLMGLSPEENPDCVALTVAAIYSVHADGLHSLLSEVRTLAGESSEPLVRETAQWVTAQVEGDRTEAAASRPGDSPRVGDARAERRDQLMAEMARIEMMVFLQGVDLFSFCNAEQVLSLAAIARESRFDEGEVIYRRNDPPDALYCVVDGRVSLVAGDGGIVTVSAGGRFGVLDILSDRSRDEDAVAAASTRVLAIEADDFFDLLSNNIEIVKALFRKLTREGKARGALC